MIASRNTSGQSHLNKARMVYDELQSDCPELASIKRVKLQQIALVRRRWHRLKT
jgi:hypothetical protein